MLLDEIKRMKEELAQAEEKEKSEEIEETGEVEEEVEEAKPKEEVEKEKAEVKEEKLDDGAYMRLRREAAAEKHRAEQAEKELNELRKAKENTAEEEQEQIQLTPELQSVIEDHRSDRAEKEFLILEDRVKKLYPEYSAVSSEYAAAMYQSIRIQNPKRSDVELNEMTKKAILMQAGEFARKGYENPVEEMFHTAKELGYTGKSFQKEEKKEEKLDAKEEKLQPDLKKVAENRKRSTGMTANNGRSEGLMTLAVAADLPAHEWAKLPKADKQRLLYGR